MAGWAAGVFTRARNWVTDKNGAINPQAALFDQEDDNFASGLNNCVTKDGLNKPSATMDWNAQNLSNVATLTAVTANITTLTATQGRGVMIPKVKTADTSRNTTVTLTDDPHLLIALAASTSYAIELYLAFDATTAAGMGMQANFFYTGTQTTASSGFVFIIGGSSGLYPIQSVSGTASYAQASVSTINNNAIIVVKTSLVTNSGGNLSVQWAQLSSNANNLNMRRGSYLTAMQTS